MTSAFVLSLASFGAAAAAGALWRRSRGASAIVIAFILTGCGAAAVTAVQVLSSDRAFSVVMATTLPGGRWILGIDTLSAWFLLVITTVAAPSALYGWRYMKDDDARAVAGTHALLAALLGSLVVVVTAQAAVLFLIAWEVMATTSYFLVVHHDDLAEVRAAGRRYLITAHAGMLALIVMFAVWSTSAGGGLEFSALADGASTLGGRMSVILCLALLGFGVKAGSVPLHFWLPGAHAGAPSHVSALMSGVVIKTGIYGLLRVASLLGDPPTWWGWTLLVLGIASGVLGVLWALAQHDIKRLLAYHSVENIGIILLGMGLGALGTSIGSPTLAVLGYAGAVLHTLNHALFKSLLFLAAGTVVRATGTRHIDQMGGLARRLPMTWLAFAVGSVAIVGLPPLNGFVSEWLVYRAFFTAGRSDDIVGLAVWGIPALALIGALALACFAKVGGVVFLGTARSPAASSIPERAGLSWPPVALAAMCALIGLAPQVILGPVMTVVNGLTGARFADAVVFTENVRAARGVALVALLAVLGATVLSVIRRLMLAGRPARRTETWGCGYARPTARMQYTASSFARPLLDYFRALAPMRVHRDSGTLETHPVDPALDWLVLPLWRVVHRLASIVERLDRARNQVLLLFVVVTLVFLLLFTVLLAGDGGTP